MNDVKNKLRDYISRSLGNTNFNDSEDLFKMGLLHSLFAMNLVVFIERNFGVELGDEDLDMAKLRSIDDMVSLVTKKQQSSSADHCITTR